MAVVVVSWLLRRLDNMVNHLNAVSSFRVGRVYKILVAVILPVVLAYMWVSDVVLKATDGYGDLPSWFVGTFGWGMSIALVVVAILLSLLPWTQRSALHSELNDNLEAAEYPEHEGTGPGVQWDTVGQPHHAEHQRKGH